MPMKKIYGIIEFPTPLVCSKDALGRTISVSIQGISGSIIFPSLPNWKENQDDPLSMLLVPPAPAKDWKQGEVPVYWGRPLSYPKGTSIVEKALFEFNISSDQSEEIAQKIYEGFNSWMKLFMQFVTLLATQNAPLNMKIKNKYGNSLYLYYSNKDSFKRISRITPHQITITVNGDSENLNFEKLQEACRLTSIGRYPKLEYVLLLEAYNARDNDDYRKAIIEAASSLEICLTNRIMQEFTDNNITYGDKLLKKFRMLGPRFELSKILGIHLPTSDYKKLILDPRNGVVHKSQFSNKVVANKVISEVEKYLKTFSPTINQDAQYFNYI